MLLLFDFPRILGFSFSSLFSVFLLSVFFYSSMFSALHPPHNQENHDSKSKYRSNTTLIRDYQGTVSIGEKALILACASQPYTLKLLHHILNILEFLTYVQHFQKNSVNILVKINYQKWIVFKNVQWFLTQLVSLITIMDSQSYKTFISKFK